MYYGIRMKIKKNITLILCFISFTGLFSLYKQYMSDRQEQSVDAIACRIAIFQPATHPALDDIAQGFIDTMQKNASLHYIFDTYNGNGNKILMQAQAQEIAHKNYDLIFTIAVTPSVMMKNVCCKQQKQTPIVFTAIDDPIKLDLQGPTITGVVDQSNYPDQLDLLLAIVPSVKKLMLVYDQSQASGLEKDKNQICSILQKKGVDLIGVEILHIGEIAQKVKGLMESVDAILVLKDNTVVSGIDSLITLCERYHIPLLTSDLNSGVKGAALAYGIYEVESGIQAAYQAQLILEDKKLPSQVPVIVITNMKMKINCQHAPLQGLHIDCHNFCMPGVELAMKGDDHV